MQHAGFVRSTGALQEKAYLNGQGRGESEQAVPKWRIVVPGGSAVPWPDEAYEGPPTETVTVVLISSRRIGIGVWRPRGLPAGS
jgi:hypothetical protein